MNRIWEGEHKIVMEDLEHISSNSGIPWEKLRNSSILVTGATGLIGSALVKALVYYAVTRGISLTVFAQVRNAEKSKAVFASLMTYVGSILHFVHADINEPLDICGNVDYIVHAASITSSQDFIHKPVDTIFTTINGTKNVLELARLKSSKSVVYVSSMEVYGRLPIENVNEQESGYINPLSVRNSYPQSKRMAENMCVAYHEQYGVNVKTVRPTLTFGPGVSIHDQRVITQFARSVLQGKDIILHTKGTMKRDYLYSADAVIGILTVLLLGKNAQAYNLSNPKTYISIYEMAQLCAESNPNICVRCEIDEDAARKYAADVKIALDNTAINKLNPFPRYDIRESFQRMLETMKDNLQA